MSPEIIGLSGSPIPNSNLDRAVKAVLEATGLEYEFIKLSDYNIRPCMACRKCVNDNTCKQEDDFGWISKKVLEADAWVIGIYSPYSQIDAFTKAFLERLWSLRHVNNLLKGKPVGLVHIRVIPPLLDKPVFRYTGLNKLIIRKIPSQKVIDQLEFELKADKMKVIGKVRVRGNIPCHTCGRGNDCQMSGAKIMYGKASSDYCIKVEDQEDVWKELQSLGRLLSKEAKKVNITAVNA